MLMSISASTETKNRAANMSRSGIDSTRAMACDLDPATSTPAKKGACRYRDADVVCDEHKAKCHAKHCDYDQRTCSPLDLV